MCYTLKQSWSSKTKKPPTHYDSLYVRENWFNVIKVIQFGKYVIQSSGSDSVHQQWFSTSAVIQWIKCDLLFQEWFMDSTVIQYIDDASVYQQLFTLSIEMQCNDSDSVNQQWFSINRFTREVPQVRSLIFLFCPTVFAWINKIYK